MKAMILAAGLGTRLKPLTDRIPKALVEIEGVTMLERLILRLKSRGFHYIVVNVHHFATQIIEFLKEKDYGIRIEISDESEKLLDTGGGILKAAPLLFKENRDPVLIHNVDILSNADLTNVMRASGGATLLVSRRESSRKLVFDSDMNLMGWHNLTTDEYRPEGFIMKGDYSEYAFSGIYSMTYDGVKEMESLNLGDNFPIMNYFLSKKRQQKICGIEGKGLRILDIGKPATLSQALEFID